MILPPHADLAADLPLADQVSLASRRAKGKRTVASVRGG